MLESVMDLVIAPVRVPCDGLEVVLARVPAMHMMLESVEYSCDGSSCGFYNGSPSENIQWLLRMAYAKMQFLALI